MEYVNAVGAYVYRCLCPGPTTPLFMPGGALEDYNEDLTQFLVAMAFFAVIDFAIVKRVIVPKARYFALHVVCNVLVCLATYKGVIRGFTEDPYTFLTGPGEVLGNNIIAALHVYHCIAFNLSADDIFHHLTFVSTLCVMGLVGKLETGINISFSAFFLSGLPGGIDYFMLTLTAHGLVSKDTQKDVYTKLNLYLRGPATVCYTFFWWIAYHHGHQSNPLIIWAAMILTIYNGMYYTQQAIESNAIYNYKKKLEAKGIVVPDVKLNNLHDTDDKKKSKKGPAPLPSPVNEDNGDSGVMSPLSGAHVPNFDQKKTTTKRK